jgi:replicative DNA helicase
MLTQTRMEALSNMEAERALLGSVLLDDAALGIVLAVVAKDDFFSEAHRLTFERMCALADRGQVIDLITVSEALSREGLLEKAGGAVYLAKLTDGVPIGTASAVAEYGRIVKEKSQCRKIVALAQNLIARTVEQSESWSEVAADGISALIALDAGEVTGLQTYREAAIELLKELEQKSVPRICTGVAGIDDRTGGFLPTELIVYSAKTGTGKTLLAQQTRRWACKHGMHSLFISCEMPGKQLVGREIAGIAGVPHKHLRARELLTQEEYGKLMGLGPQQCPKCTVLHNVVTIGAIAAAARRVKADNRLSLLIIDYDELVLAPGKTENEQLSNVAKGAWQLAVSLHVPVILISQLRKGDGESAGNLVILDQLYGSGAKCKHASTVIYIHRDFNKQNDAVDLQDAAIGVAKDRHGDLGWSDVWFSKRRLEFLNRDESNVPAPAERHYVDFSEPSHDDET